MAAVTPPSRPARSRPRRGRPEETRDRLVATAADVFNRVGYHGTDSNRIARAAGYAAGTFYRHFPDKRAVLLAAYERWVTREWADVARVVRSGGAGPVVAAHLVDMVVDLHRRWRGLRASLRALVAEDATARAFYRGQRRRQLALLEGLAGAGPGRRERYAVLLYTLERVADAIADGELRATGVAVAPTVGLLRELLVPLLDGTSRA